MKNFVLYLILFVSLLIIIKYINHLLELKKLSLIEEIDKSQKNNGLLSINDLTKIDASNFLNISNTFLSEKGYKNIRVIKDSDTSIPSLTCSLNEEPIFITLISNSKPESENVNIHYLEIFIANMLKHNCKKGILFTNSVFNTEYTRTINKFNTNSSFKIQLVDGYELSKFIRNLTLSSSKEAKYV